VKSCRGRADQTAHPRKHGEASRSSHRLRTRLDYPIPILAILAAENQSHKQ
jgi:hypothetical protein